MNNNAITFLQVLILLIVAKVSNADTVTFELIPNASSADDMSPDGRYIVGGTDTNGDGSPDHVYLLDTASNTVIVLPDLGIPYSGTSAVSDDGLVVLSDIADPQDPNPNPAAVAGMWTASTGWTSLGYLPNAGTCPSRSDGYELSANGSVAVGLSWDGCSGRGFRWTQATGMVQLQVLSHGANRASVVSADGNVIGGFAQGNQSRTPAIWNAAGQGQLLDPTGNSIGEVQGIADDGTILLGTWLGASDTVSRAVTWTYPGLVRSLVGTGSLRPNWGGIPMDVALDRTIVGFDFLIGNRFAWIQPRGSGPIQDLATYITSHGGTVPEDFQLEVCQAISANGRYIIGHSGYYSQGAWRVTIDKLGDINLDGYVDLVDADALVAVLLGTPINPQDITRSDIDQNGVADGRDISAFVRVLLTQ